MIKGDVVQFNEKHKWCGCLGIISEVKQCCEDIRYYVGVSVPIIGTTFIYVMARENAIEYIGRANLTLRGYSYVRKRERKEKECKRTF